MLSKDLLLQTVWAGKTVTDESLLVAISQLRKALSDDARTPSYIKTIPGKGYQFIAMAGPVAASGRLSWTWGACIAAGLACVAAIAGSLVVAGALPSPNTGSDQMKAESRIVMGDPASLKSAVQTLLAVAAQRPSPRAFTSLAEAKMRLMGDSLAVADNCREIIDLLNKAISLDAAYPKAYVLRGEARFECRHDFAGAETDYLIALRLQPGNDEAALRYSSLLLAGKRFDESLQQINTARQSNPLYYSAPMVVWLYQMQGRDDLAYQELVRMEGAGADNRWFHISALRVLVRARRDEEAFGHLEWLMRQAGVSQEAIGEARTALRAGGMKAVYGWLLARKETADLGDYTPPLSWARYALAANRPDQGMPYLEDAFARHQMPLLWAGVDPAYAILHDNPRFRALSLSVEPSRNRP